MVAHLASISDPMQSVLLIIHQ